MIADVLEGIDFSPRRGSGDGVEAGPHAEGRSGLLPWDGCFDVVVVGFGAAGAAAAIEARRAGASVCVADRFDGGGATALSGGVVYLGGGTELQKRAGYDDTPENMFRYLALEAKDAVAEDVLRAYCDASVEMFEWLRSHGVPFPPSGGVAKTSYPLDDCTLYFSGNEDSPPFRTAARPAPRGHRVFGRGPTGRVLFACLGDAVRSLGAEIRPHARARRLVVDAEGRVLGVELLELPPDPRLRRHHARLARRATRWGSFSARAAVALERRLDRVEERSGKTRLLRARGGVILAAGGFSFNPGMVARYAPLYLRATVRLGTIGDSGEGVRLGQSVGGAVAKMERCTAWRFIRPPHAWVRGVIVGPDGRRLCNEELYGAALGDALAAVGGRGYLVLDAAAEREARRELRHEPMQPFQRVFGLLATFANTKRARSVAALARRCGIPPAALERTLSSYNEAARRGRDPFGKAREHLQPLVEPPFAAMRLDFEARRFPAATMTLGGLRTEGLTGRVLRADGSAIEGLYAAGRNAVGICSHSYVSGLSIGDGLFAGRCAGRHAAARARASR